MILRRLRQEEHIKTRKLWEEVFEEDTKEFLDYYYFIKARNNEIYVVEEDGDIQAMLQLNPYTLRIEDGQYQSDYIIAVSTRKEYRGRGYMGNLLRRAMGDMYRKKMPFTFLMPAAEQIYTPYDFRFIYRQQVRVQEEAGDMAAAGDKVRFSDAVPWDAAEMSEFFEQNYAGRWQVFAIRDEEYYRTMILEQQSEHGGVKLMRDNENRIVGMFAYALEGAPEIREPLYLPGYEEDFARGALLLCGDDPKPVKIYGGCDKGECEERPVIMARILYLPALFTALKVSEDVSLDCSFAVIDSVIQQNSRVWEISSSIGEEHLHVRETEDSEGVLPIAELTELLFGVKTAGEIRKSEGVIMTDRMEVELDKLKKLKRIFLNEIV